MDSERVESIPPKIKLEIHGWEIILFENKQNYNWDLYTFILENLYELGLFKLMTRFENPQTH